MFTSLFKAALNTIATPVDVVKDVFTLGGLNTDQQEPYTVQRVKKIGECLEKALDPDQD